MKQVKGANYRVVVRTSPIEGDGLFAGEELTYDYGSDYYPRKGKRAK
jgi:hypothetical protein